MSLYQKKERTSYIERTYLDRPGEFILRVDGVKNLHDKAIVEGQIIQVNGAEPEYKVGEDVNHLVNRGKYDYCQNMMEDFTAAYNGIDVNHRFDEDDAKNSAIWGAKIKECFSELVFDPKANAMVADTSNSKLKGIPILIKTVRKYNKETKEATKFCNVYVQRLATPADMTETTLSAYGKTLPPEYLANAGDAQPDPTPTAAPEVAQEPNPRIAEIEAELASNSAALEALGMDPKNHPDYTALTAELASLKELPF